MDFYGVPVVKNLPCNVGDTGLIFGWGNRPHMPPVMDKKNNEYLIINKQKKT